MSRTRKDSRRVANTVLEIIERADGTFDLLLNRRPDQSHISERSLYEQLCIRFGFCGNEYEAILAEVHRSGKKEIVWG